MAFLGLALLTLFAVAAACSSGDDNGDGDSDGDSTPTATASPDGDGDGDGNGDGNGDGDGGDSDDLSAILSDLGADFANSSGKVTYDFAASDGGTDSTDLTDGEMTLYWRPPDWRMDMDISDPVDGEIQSTFIVTEDASYICSAADSDGFCFSSDLIGDSDIPIPFLGFLTEPEGVSDIIALELADADVDIEESSETIAGVSADCFSVSGTVDDETADAEYCFSDNGLLLRIAFSGDDASGTFSLEATDSGDVSDSDFEPPYDVTDLSDLEGLFDDLDLGDLDLDDLLDDLEQE
jgi:hypothetical protein